MSEESQDAKEPENATQLPQNISSEEISSSSPQSQGELKDGTSMGIDGEEGKGGDEEIETGEEEGVHLKTEGEGEGGGGGMDVEENRNKDEGEIEEKSTPKTDITSANEEPAKDEVDEDKVGKESEKEEEGEKENVLSEKEEEDEAAIEKEGEENVEEEEEGGEKKEGEDEGEEKEEEDDDDGGKEREEEKNEDEGKDGQKKEEEEEKGGEVKEKEEERVQAEEGGKKEDVTILVNDGEEVVEGTKEEEEEEAGQVFEYSYNEMKSSPEVVDVSIDNMLQLHHSYGYECHKRFNLVVLGISVVAYAAGNLVIILDLESQQQTRLRSLGGGGIGAIAAHPRQEYFAVGEKGIKPVIAIYAYPDLTLHRLLRDGTEALYSHMDFSPGDGNLLASIGGNPDYMLTVWDWKKEKIVLRYKAFSQEIYRVSFSPENAEQLTTSGTGHIRFWKMATTFTGLKLQGQLGKFGRVEISDISAYVELPDGKVLSGTEWGNFLLWDGGFIKVELSKKNKKFCHNGMIEAIYLDEGELISAGVDGFIKVWDFETIDSADISDENATFELEPMLEIKVGSSVCFKSLTRSVDPDTPTLWYGQDASGAIWAIDIVVSHTRKAPKKLMSFHGGRITGLNCSPITHQAASIAENGSVRVYDLPEKKLLCHSEFASGGSSLLWAPTSVDVQAVTIIAGFTDGVIRVLRLEEKDTTLPSQQHKGHVGKYWLNLVHVCKPHNKAITCMAIDPDGKLLASGGKDNIVFFISITDDYNPIGFIHSPSPVTNLLWSKKNKGERLVLLVCSEDGSMMEVDAPNKEEYNTNKTYHLDMLKFTSRKFISIKDKLRAQEEEERKAILMEKKRLAKEEKKKAKKELLGDDYVSDDEEDDEEEEEEEEGEGKEEKQKPEGPSSILRAFYSNKEDGNYWISMDGYDAGYLYQCTMDGAKQDPEPKPYEPFNSIPVPKICDDDIPLHSLIFSSSGEYFLTGSDNGYVRVHPLSTPRSLSDLSTYWSLSMHDNHYGAVTHLVTSFDDQFVLSGGADGNVFVYQANLPTAAERAAAASIKIPLQSEKTADDIDDPEHYSIEDAKQKAEHDRKMKLAEEKKQHVRRQIASLRRTFAKLQSRNSLLPSHLRLANSEFVMDPDMEKNMKKQTEEKVELVHKEMSWESEKHRIALDKLKKKFKDGVDCERFVVWSFDGEQQVSSFRTPLPSQRFMEIMEELVRDATSSRTMRSAVPASEEGKKMMDSSSVGLKKNEGHQSAEEGGEMKEGENIEQEMSKEALRKYRKQQRAKERQELENKKPSAKSDGSEDAAILQQARDNLGDYKLKTAENYVVPEDKRVTTIKKREQLIRHRQQILDTKKSYNEKLIALRDKKLLIVDKIIELIEKMKSLQSTMEQRYWKPLPPIPVIRPEEVPERELEYTKESLLKFKEEKAERDRAEKLEAAGGGEGGFFGGFGGGGGGGEGGGGEEEGKKEMEGEEAIAGDSTQIKQEGTDGDGEKVEGQEDSDSVSSYDQEMKAMNPIQRIRHQEHQIRCIYEQDKLLKEIQRLQEDFDSVLTRLCHDKAYLDITIIAANLKHITQFEEMTLLKDFEKRGTTFTTRYKTKKHEKMAITMKIQESQRELSVKEKKLAKLIEQEKALTQSFIESVGDNKFKDFLMKVFRKKVKRAKRKPERGEGKKDGVEDDEEEESEEESESDFSSSDEDSEDEGELDDSVCPAGCDPALFSKACELREQRLDLEEMVAEEKRLLEVQRKELDSQKKKAKSVDSQVKNARADLQAFQLKKQQKLNELDQVVVLYLHQLMHYQPLGKPPTSIAPCLVFSASALEKLDERIGALALEKQQEKKKFKELKHTYKKMGREKKEMLSDLNELNDRVNDAMLMKFGQIVDLEKLEVLQSNPVIEEKRHQLREMEYQGNQEVAAVQAKINQKKKELLNVVRENTLRLNRKHSLITTMRGIEERLDIRQKSMSKEVAGNDCHLTPEEHEKLLEIIQLQSLDIQNVRGEIQILQHKGGHILPPSQPPQPPPPETS